MNTLQITDWLRETAPRRLEALWALADETRHRNVGDAVHLRALIEISSHCRRACHYCGLRADRAGMVRYRMETPEIVDCALAAGQLGCGTVVLQAGEDPALTEDRVADLIERIRARMPGLAITLSLGERTDEELRAWKLVGADRYLLRFETSNRELYGRIHPPLAGRHLDRLAMLRSLREMGYETGSGVMVGIPGQTYGDLAGDVALFAGLDLDMIGIGPFISHPDTPLGRAGAADADVADHVPATEEMTYKAMAIARLVCPGANIPSTTALATLNRRDGRELGLMRGANVVMPNLTPAKYRRLYEIYPNKACIDESPLDCGRCLKGRIESIGRTVGAGRGDSPRMAARFTEAAAAKET